MTGEANVPRAVHLITRPTSVSDRELADLMASSHGTTVVRKLLTWPDPAVRFWALDAAGSTLPWDEYLVALKRAMRDPDEVVSQEAIGRLVDVAPAAIRPIALKLARKLTTDIPNAEKVFVLWTLAKLRATEQLHAIESFRRDVPDWWQLARVADVVLTYLRLGADSILDMIRDHSDHLRMEELCTMAWHVIRTPKARKALRLGAENAPDDPCREACRYALRQFGSG